MTAFILIALSSALAYSLDEQYPVIVRHAVSPAVPFPPSPEAETPSVPVEQPAASMDRTRHFQDEAVVRVSLSPLARAVALYRLSYRVAPFVFEGGDVPDNHSISQYSVSDN